MATQSDAHRAGGAGADGSDGGGRGLLVIISGPSGVGKTTITHAVVDRTPGAVFSVSCTTRPRTDADVEGRDYFFLSAQEFAKREAQGDFLETAEVFGNRYGTPRRWVDEQLASGRVVILEIDVIGAIKVKRQMPTAFGLFVLPPDEETLLARLRARRREDETTIQRRFAEARREIEQAKSSDVYDRFVVNDELDRAIDEALKAVAAAREAVG